VQLQPDEHEQDRVDDEVEDVPDEVALQACAAREDLRRADAHVDAGRDRGQDPRGADGVRRHVGRVAGQERDGDVHLGVGDALADLGDDHPHDEAHGHAPSRPEYELQAGVGEREAPGHHGGDRDAVGHQGGHVVEQTLALDAAHHAPRGIEAPHDRRRRERVGWRDDRPEDESGFPGQARNERVGGPGDRAHRRDHQRHRVEGERAQAGPEVVEVRLERRAVDQRRQEDNQHDLRVELHLGQPRDKPEQGPADNQHDRIRHRQAPGEHAQARHRHQQPGDQQLGLAHCSSILTRPHVRGRPADGIAGLATALATARVRARDLTGAARPPAVRP
jgi:hypothetical protein